MKTLKLTPSACLLHLTVETLRTTAPVQYTSLTTRGSTLRGYDSKLERLLMAMRVLCQAVASGVQTESRSLDVLPLARCLAKNSSAQALRHQPKQHGTIQAGMAMHAAIMPASSRTVPASEVASTREHFPKCDRQGHFLSLRCLQRRTCWSRLRRRAWLGLAWRPAGLDEYFYRMNMSTSNHATKNYEHLNFFRSSRKSRAMKKYHSKRCESS